MSSDNKSEIVSIILPCFNELENIIPLIHEIKETLNDRQIEIIVVDDNSPDNTYEAVKSLQIENVKAILRTTDRGFAKSIRTGIESSNGNIIVIMDSDYNHKPAYLPTMISNCQFYDVVLGSRFVYGGSMGSKFRHMSSWIFNIFVRIITRKMITDSLFGYIAINRNTLNQLNFDDIFWGYGDYCIRLMYYLQENKTNILQIPMELGNRKYGKGNSRLVKTFIQYSKEAITLAFKNNKVLKKCTKK